MLIGGGVDASLRRAARHADGWTQGGAGPDPFRPAVAKLNEYWQAEGCGGSPYTMALFYFGLGEGAKEHARENLGHYYAWLGEELADMIVESAATDADTVRSYLAAFEGTCWRTPRASERVRS